MSLPKKGQLDIISCGVNTSSATNAVNVDTNLFSLKNLKPLFLTADMVFASRSLLEECTPYFPDHIEKQVIGAKARQDAQDALMLAKEGKHIIALASGDALYNGFGSTVASLATKEDIIIYHPNITAFQTLFHRLGLPWAEAKLFSAHSGTNIPLRPFMEAPLSVIYGGTQNPVQDIAKAVIKIQASMQTRFAIIAEKLGTKDEKIVSGALSELATMSFGATSILLLLPYTSLPYCNVRTLEEDSLSQLLIPSNSSSNTLNTIKNTMISKGIIPFNGEFERQSLSNQNNPDSLQAPILPLGLPIDFYEKENNLITSAEVRAIALSKLQLPSWGVLWDIGAGSGSVGLECASLRPYLEVHAIEQKRQRLEHIKANQQKLGVHNYTLHHAEASELIAENLPPPDRIFFGGGGAQITRLLELCMAKLKPNGIIVVSVITTEAIQALYAFKPKCRQEVCRIDIALEQKIAGQYHHLKPQNTIHLFTFKNEVSS